MPPAVLVLGLIGAAIIYNVESSPLACPKKVTGTLDGSVTIKCSYSTITKANIHTRKFLCRQGGRIGKCKDVTISTNGYVHQDFWNRASIEDYDGKIYITLSGLKKIDEGTYMCGIGNDVNGLMAPISVSVIEDSVIPTEAELLYGQLRGTVNFRCEFDEQDAARRKYLCKISKGGCTNVVDSLGAVATNYHGRIVLQPDAKKPGSFTVKLIQLRNEDTGLFSCGLGSYGEDGESTHFDLRINEETDIPQGSRSLSPRLGGSLSAQCNYNPKKNYSVKFWCKWTDSVCNPLIKTDGYVQEAYEGRLSIEDNPTNGTMQVLMNRITKEDEGWYWCVLTDGKHDQTSTVQVKISEENLEGLTGDAVKYVTAGATAKIPCSYPCRFKSYEKFWCKWSNSGCKRVASTDDDQSGLSVTCDTQELVLTIDEVSEKDSGWYWCGVKKAGRYGETIAVQMLVEQPTKNVPNGDKPNGDKPNGDKPNGDKPNGDKPNGDMNARANFPGDARNAPVNVTPASSDSGRNSAVTATIVSICAVVLVVSAVFFFRLRRKKNSDLVSVGSYRTNISMTDLDSGIGKDNPAVIETKDTDISSTEGRDSSIIYLSRNGAH